MCSNYDKASFKKNTLDCGNQPLKRLDFLCSNCILSDSKWPVQPGDAAGSSRTPAQQERGCHGRQGKQQVAARWLRQGGRRVRIEVEGVMAKE